MPTLNPILESIGLDPKAGTDLESFVIVAAVVGVVYYVLIWRTRFGYDLRASGINPIAAQASGVASNEMIVKGMVLSGMVAGLVGLPVLLGFSFNYNLDFPTGLGFAGITVALLGRNNPIGIAAGALLLGFLDRSAQILDLEGIPKEIVVIMEGVIVLVGRHRLRGRRAHHRAPRAAADGREHRTTRGGAGRGPGRSRRHERVGTARRPGRARRPVGGRPGCHREGRPHGCGPVATLDVHRRGSVLPARRRALDHRQRGPDLERDLRHDPAPGGAHRARRPRGHLLRAGRCGEHRPRRDDDPGDVVRGLGRLAVRALVGRGHRGCRWRRRRPVARIGHRDLRGGPDHLRGRHHHPRRGGRPVPLGRGLRQRERGRCHPVTPGRRRRRLRHAAPVGGLGDPRHDGLAGGPTLALRLRRRRAW